MATFDTCLNHEIDQDLFSVLQVEEAGTGETPRFPCCPLRAYSMERHTVYGRFTGQIGLARSAEFLEAMYDLSTGQAMRVILDFSDMQLSKSAAGELVSFAANMFGRNKRLYLYKISPQINKLLNELTLRGFFTTIETEDDIIAICEG
ncbi:hypothetical protein LJC46_06315 [Desulfovibrio sp. OttesenSCG-928-G15]|nr:hypothetical protein [Desulfovibrio sp. OttesenSCG-928-G15]